MTDIAKVLAYGAACGLGWLATAAWAGPREEVNASIDKFLAARSFHAAMATGGPRPINHQLDFLAPGRYRMRMPDMGEQYIIGDTLYLSLGGGAGRMLRMPMPQGTLSNWRDPAQLAANAQAMSVTALGEDNVAGMAAMKYRIDHSAPPSTMTLWIGRDGYPLQIVTDSATRGQAPMTIRYSRFNDPAIRIEPPR